MYEVLSAKFTQHEDIQRILLSTDTALLVEHTGNDSYWGDGGDGNGKNRLGSLLMQVREELRETSPKSSNNNNSNNNINLTKQRTTSPESNDEEEEEEEDGSDSNDEVSSTGSENEDQNEPASEKEKEKEKDIDLEIEQIYQPPLLISSVPLHVQLLQEQAAQRLARNTKKQAKEEKKKRAGRTKAQRKRSIFVDCEGNSTMERSNETKGIATTMNIFIFIIYTRYNNWMKIQISNSNIYSSNRSCKIGWR